MERGVWVKLIRQGVQGMGEQYWDLAVADESARAWGYQRVVRDPMVGEWWRVKG